MQNQTVSEGQDDPCVVHEYLLGGPQVQPDASYWMYCSKLHIVKIDELRAVTDDPNKKSFFPPYPDPCTVEGKAQTEKEFAELVDLAKRRDDPCSLVNANVKGSELSYPQICDFHNTLPKAYGFRAPISRLFNLHPSPLGAVLMNRYPGEQIIRTGRGMARAVESETPGIFHRHALNYLMGTRHWSPPRQALIWAALDVTIASALQAAWYYKWIGRGTDLTARRERPSEYANRNGINFNVLYDRPDELNPAYNLCPDGRPCASGNLDPDGQNNNASGTPRHPAYPSGHSTFSGAASEFLKFFFGNDPVPEFLLAQNTPGARKAPQGAPDDRTIGEELDNMAENIGLGRMWAGVHWRSDHEAGRKLGRVVACLVLQQLADMGAVDGDKVTAFVLCPPEPNLVDQCDCAQHQTPCPNKNPQTDYARAELLKQAEQIKAHCEETKKRDNPCPAPPNPHDSLDSNRGVQQGAL
jgi:membrane-associated phospholipid phosphatase